MPPFASQLSYLPPLSLRVHVEERKAENFPFDDDDSLGERLWERMEGRIGRPLAPALIVLRNEQVDMLDLLPLVGAGASLQLFASSAAGQPGVQCVALLGTPSLVRAGHLVGRAAVAFLEWPDNRWWQAFQPLDPSFGVMPDFGREVHRAVDGMPRPGGLGGWFSTARYFNLALKLERSVDTDDGPLVH
jgi:hypothetical protein